MAIVTVCPDEYLIDRRVRVWWDGNSDCLVADVIGYDPVKKLHKLQVMDDFTFLRHICVALKLTVVTEHARAFLFLSSKVL